MPASKYVDDNGLAHVAINACAVRFKISEEEAVHRLLAHKPIDPAEEEERRRERTRQVMESQQDKKEQGDMEDQEDTEVVPFPVQTGVFSPPVDDTWAEE